MTEFLIDGQHYKVDNLSEDGHRWQKAVKFCDQEIDRLDLRESVLKTALNGYSHVLLTLLPNDEVSDDMVLDNVKTVTVNERKYDFTSLSDEAVKHIQAIQETSAALDLLRTDRTIAKTARMVYVRDLIALLE